MHGPTPSIFLSLDYQPLFQVDYLRARHVCCPYNSLRIPGTLAWRILSVLCSPFHRLPLPRFFLLKAFFDRPPHGVCITGWIGDLSRSASPPPERLLGASLGIPAPRGCAIYLESYLASLTARFCPYWFGQGVFSHPLFFIFFCGEPAGRVSVVPYSSSSMVCWRFSGALVSIPTV